MRAALLVLAAVAIAGAIAQTAAPARHPFVVLSGYQNGRMNLKAPPGVTPPAGCELPAGGVQLGAQGYPDSVSGLSPACQWYWLELFNSADGKERRSRADVTFPRTGTFEDIKVDTDRIYMKDRVVNAEGYTPGVDFFVFAIDMRYTAKELSQFTNHFAELDEMILRAKSLNGGLAPVVGCWSLGCNVLEEYLAVRNVTDPGFQEANTHYSFWGSADLGGERDVPGAFTALGNIFIGDAVLDAKAMNNFHGLAVAMPALELYGDEPAMKIGNAHPKTWSQIPNILRQNGFGEFASVWLNNAPQWRVPAGNVAVVFPVNGTCPTLWYLSSRVLATGVYNVDMAPGCDTEQPTKTNAALSRWFTQVLYPKKMIMESLPEVTLQDGQEDYHTAQLSSEAFWKVVRRISATT